MMDRRIGWLVYKDRQDSMELHSIIDYKLNYSLEIHIYNAILEPKSYVYTT